MKKFLQRLILFFLIPSILILVLSFVVPATPRASKSLLFSKIDKEELFFNYPPPRLILVGGSNLAYGIDSAILEEGLGIKTINSAIHVTQGAKYMLDSSLQHIGEGDVVVLVLEYQQFFGSEMYGGEELLRTIFDVDRSSMKYLNLRQWINIGKYLPEYAISKIKPSEYNFKENPYIGIYERGSFNEYGDAYIHWTRDPIKFEPLPRSTYSYNPDLIEYILEYDERLIDQGAKLYVTFPGLQSDTYSNMEDQILKVEHELFMSDLSVIGSSQQYRLSNNLFHDTPYHLTYEGVILRSEYLLEGLKMAGVGLDE